MATWAMVVLPDGQFKVVYAERAGADFIDCGTCPSHTPRDLILAWLADNAEHCDLIDTGQHSLVKLAATKE